MLQEVIQSGKCLSDFQALREIARCVLASREREGNVARQTLPRMAESSPFAPRRGEEGQCAVISRAEEAHTWLVGSCAEAQGCIDEALEPAHLSALLLDEEVHRGLVLDLVQQLFSFLGSSYSKSLLAESRPISL